MSEFVGSDGKTWEPISIIVRPGERSQLYETSHLHSFDPDFPAAVRALEEMVEKDHTSTVANHVSSLWDAAKWRERGTGDVREVE